jgi:hypothetical protein
MSTDFSSYFILGFLLFIVGVGIFSFVKTSIIKLAIKTIPVQWVLSALLVLCFTIPFFLITTSLLVNDSIARSKQEYVESKIGTTDGVIYDRLQNTSWNDTDINKITGNLKNNFDYFLPIFIKETVFENPNVGKKIEKGLIINFNQNTAYNYNSRLIDENINFSLSDKDVVIAKSLAESLLLKEGDTIKITSEDFTIKQIIKDNGLIGFNNALTTNYFPPQGSVFIGNSGLKRIAPDFPADGKLYNTILVSRINGYDKSVLVNDVQDKLFSIDKNLLFDEVGFSLFDSLNEWSNGLNMGQVILLFGLIPFIAVIALLITLLELQFKSLKQTFTNLSIIGYKRVDIIRYLVFQNTLYSTVAGIIGVGLAILLNNVILQSIKNELLFGPTKFDYYSLLKNQVTFQSIIFSYTGIWIVLLLISTLWAVSRSNFDLGITLKKITPIKIDELSSRKLLILGGILISPFVIYYLISRSPTTTASAKAIVQLVSYLTVIWTITYGLKYKIKETYLFIPAAILSILVAFLFSTVFKSRELWNLFPILKLITLGIYIVNIIILVLYSSHFLSKIVDRISPKSSILRKFFKLVFNIPRQRKLYTFLSIFATTIIISAVNIGYIFNSFIDKAINETYIGGFDTVVSDNLGINNIVNLLPANNNNEVQKISYTVAKLPEFPYKSLQFYDKEKFVDISEDEAFRTQVSVLPEEILKEQKIKFESSDSLEKFNTSSEYIIVGQSYLKEMSERNLRPDISIGKKVSIQLPGKVVLSRTIIGIVEEIDNKGNFDPGIFLQNGILLGNKDYESLQKNEKVFFPSIYGARIDYKSSDPLVDENEFVNKLKSTSISNITFKRIELEKGQKLKNFLKKLLILFLTLSLILLAIVYGTVSLLYSGIAQIKESSLLYKATLIGGATYDIIIGIVLALLTLLFLKRNFNSFVIEWRFFVIIISLFFFAAIISLLIHTFILRKLIFRNGSK